MFNPFKGNQSEPTSPSQENDEGKFDRRAIRQNMNNLLSASALAIAGLFAAQGASAKDVSQAELEPTVATAEAKNLESQEAAAYTKILIASNELQRTLCEDPEITKCIDEILTLVPKDPHANDEPAYFDLSDARLPSAGEASPFVNMNQLDLTLKNLKNPSMFSHSEISKRIDTMTGRLSADNYVEKFRAIEMELKALEPIFASRTIFQPSTMTTNSTKIGWITSNKNPLGYGSLEKKITTTEAVPSTRFKAFGTGAPTQDFGNKEIYVLMNAMKPLGTEVGKFFAKAVGCNINSVVTNVDLFSSVHTGTDGKVSKIPFNNVHPTFSIEACQKEYSSTNYTFNSKEKPITMTPFVSLFSNSNGPGAPNINALGSTVQEKIHIFGNDPSKDIKRTITSTETFPSNRLIMTAGAKIDLPILSSNINFRTKLGIQYGYTVGNNKLSPMASFSFVYKDKESSLDGFEVGLVPAATSTKGVNPLNAVYFSTKYSVKF